MDNYIVTNDIGSPDCFEVEYYKNEHSTSVFHISDIRVSEKYGEEYVTAICHESESEITLKIDRIKHITPHWIKIIDENMVAPKSGLFVFACLGDMHIVYETIILNKGDSLIEYFTGDDAPTSGCCPLKPVAFHYISFPLESFCLF